MVFPFYRWEPGAQRDYVSWFKVARPAIQVRGWTPARPCRKKESDFRSLEVIVPEASRGAEHVVIDPAFTFDS